jgi:hypothetical protein
MKLSYYLRVISGARFKKMFKVIDDVNKKCNKSKIYIFFDMINCMIRYGAGYYDYNIFAFYAMNHKQRKTYITRMKNKKLIMYCNDQNYSHIFNNKNEFNKIYKKYLNREYLDLENVKYEDFTKFMKNKDIIFAKPNVGESGKGIEKLYKKDYKDLKEMFNYITNKDKNFGIIEELIVQHEALNKLYPLAINSLRIVSIVVDGEAHIVYVVSKSGNEGKFVDNMENSGLCCPVDVKTGKICNVAHTSKLITYDTHPYSKVKLIGYKIPYIKEAMELVKKAALEIPEVKYVGWDVFIGPNGPGIIEGNDYPGYDFWQLPEHTPDKIGLVPYYESLIKDLKL